MEDISKTKTNQVQVERMQGFPESSRTWSGLQSTLITDLHPAVWRRKEKRHQRPWFRLRIHITNDEAEVESSSFDADGNDIMVENWGGDSDDHLLRETSDNDSTENSPSGSVSEKGRNGSIASGSSSKTLSAKSKGKAIKSRSWGAAESKPSKHAVERALIKTAARLLSR